MGLILRHGCDMFLTLYPVDWERLAREIKEANHYCCAECGKQCRRPGEFWLGWEYELTVAHWDHEYDDAAIFVACLCVRCHLRHDCRHSWRARRRNAGQLTLSLR